MAPSPENDSSPKAPDKNEKPTVNDSTKENDKDAKTLSNLNDEELKALLDEAMNYKNPKDREGKSKLFKNLLNKAVEDERKNRATSAGGSELVRYCNPSAKRNGRHRRKPSSSSCSIAEQVMHGGSLDNLAKEELYEADRRLQRTRKNVSARQREGGSLPCNVNSGISPASELQFLEEARLNRATNSNAVHHHKDYTAIDMESVSLLENDVLAQTYQEQTAPSSDMSQNNPANNVPVKFTSKATLQVCANVDDPIQLPDMDSCVTAKTFDSETIQTKVLHSKYSVYIPTYKIEEPKKTDENANALQQQGTSAAKPKKKKANDKNVTVLIAEAVQGHRSDIINDIPSLMAFIDGPGATSSSTTTLGGGKSSKSGSLHKSKQQQLQKQHTTEEGTTRSKKQRAHSSKGSKETGAELKKSNSMGEISTVNLEAFAYGVAATSSATGSGIEDKVVLRTNKASSADRPRERRSWGNVEPPSFQALYTNASADNLENTENWIETKTKKKSKKRRNSMSSSGGAGIGRRQTTGADASSTSVSTSGRHHRTSSPNSKPLACSMPHSERSADSSDADSVNSLPIDGLNAPASYAEKLKEKKLSPEKVDKVPNKDKSPNTSVCGKQLDQSADTLNISSGSSDSVKKSSPGNVVNVPVVATVPLAVDTHANTAVQTPPDVTNIKSFPAISNGRVISSNSSVATSSVVAAPPVSPGGKNVAAVGNKTKVQGQHKVVKNQQQNPHKSNSVSNDIQNDLTIIQANERGSIQFNAQMLPPNIPDVATIEKMQFMNHSQHHVRHHHQPPPPSPLQHPMPPPMNQFHLYNPQQYHHPHHPHHFSHPPPPPPYFHQQHQMVLNNGGSTSRSPPSAYSSPPNNHHVVSPAYQQPPPPPVVVGNHHQVQQTAAPPVDEADAEEVEDVVPNATVNCDSAHVDRTSVAVAATPSPSETRSGKPAVVIVNHSNSDQQKEVSGLEFGFAVNEQLLSEDRCERFIARYRFPEAFERGAHNHDKIVNYIGQAWESVVNETDGKAVYFGDSQK